MDNLGYTADVDETPPPKYKSRRVAIAPSVIIESGDDDVDVQNNAEDDDNDNDDDNGKDNNNSNGVAGSSTLEREQSASRICEASEETRRVTTLVHNWLCFFCELTNIHGMKWYVITPNIGTRILFFLYVLVFVITVPLYFFLSYIDIYFSMSAGASVEWKKDTTMAYPNVTVCFPKYFDSRLMEDEGVSPYLANYMTMALDPNVGHLVSFMREEIPDYDQLLKDLQLELDHQLDSKNLTLIDLFHRIAMKCESFVTLCEVHREFLFSTPDYPPEQKCCGALFNPVPFFTGAGTCFTTNQQQVQEVLPFTFSSIKIWLNLQGDNTPEFELIFKGSDALDRHGVYYAISENDHPVTKLLQLPFKAQPGTNVLISLNVQQIDRTALRPDVFCRSDVDVFEEKYRVPYTKLNCDFFSGTDAVYNCSHAKYYGIDLDTDEALCEPKDFVDASVNVEDEYFLEPYVENVVPCLPRCFYTEYITEVTEATIDPGAVERYENAVGVNELGDPDELVVMQLYFNSFDFATISMSQTDFVTYLGTIGGWLSMLCGFSLVSLAELLFFLTWLTLKILFKRKMEKKKTPEYILKGGKVPII